jgi:gluconolactonase
LPDVTVVAEGLVIAEGPSLLPDGRIVFVEIARHRISAWDPERGVHLYADIGAPPTSTAVGLDGLYVAQNGSGGGPWRTANPVPASILKVTLDGRIEVVTTSAGGRPLNAPNELVFGPDGRLYFTDSGDWDPDNPQDGYVCVIEPDGTTSIIVEAGPVYANGIVVEPDGSVVWDEGYPRHVRRRRADATIELVATLPEGSIPDGMKYGEDGLIYIAGVSSGGVHVITPEGELVRFIETGGMPLSCIFRGQDLYVTDLGDEGQTPENGFAPRDGRLLRVPVGVSGRPPYRGKIAGLAISA